MIIENEELEWIKIQIENNPNIDLKNTGWNHPHFTELKKKRNGIRFIYTNSS